MRLAVRIPKGWQSTYNDYDSSVRRTDALSALHPLLFEWAKPTVKRRVDDGYRLQ